MTNLEKLSNQISDISNSYSIIDKSKLSKCLKSYLIGKQYYNIDKNKSIEYLKQCINYINNFKHIINESSLEKENTLINILEETEIECNKYINFSIIDIINKPIDINFIDIDLFNLIETCNINEIKKYNYGNINFSVFNNEGLTALHYAIKFGDTKFIKEALILGANIDQTNSNGHTLLEFACLENDPNLINFLIQYGADMKKHLYFRENQKYINRGTSIDILLLEKYIFENGPIDNSYKIKYLSWIFKYINKNQVLDIEVINLKTSKIIVFKTLIKYLDNILDNFDIITRNTYINILKEELNYNLIYNLDCPQNKVHIILYNLVPFINYNFNLKLIWLLNLEIKFIILNILTKYSTILLDEFKIKLKSILYEKYIKTKIIQKELLEIIINQWILKIKI